MHRGGGYGFPGAAAGRLPVHAATPAVRLGTTLATSSKSHYYYHEAIACSDRSWNDGLFVRDPNGNTHGRMLALVCDLARNMLGMKRDLAICAFHTMRK